MSYLGRLALAAIASSVAGCTTDAGTAAGSGYDRSTLVATSRPVSGMTIAGRTLYWIDDAGSVWSCDKAACHDAPSVIYLSPGAADAGPSANGGMSSVGYSVPPVPYSEIAVSGGWVFWVTNAALYGCPTAGCPAGPLTALTTQSVSTFFADTAGGTGVYWVGTRPYNPGSNLSPAFNWSSTVYRFTPGCGASCPEDLIPPVTSVGASSVCDPQTETCASCASDADCSGGQFCTTKVGSTAAGVCTAPLAPGQSCYLYVSPLVCATGTCQGGPGSTGFGAVCPPVSQPTGQGPSSSQGIAVVAGQVYFATGDVILSCAVASCSSLSNTTYFSEASNGPNLTIVGAGNGALYFSDGNGLQSCSLPQCNGTPLHVGPSIVNTFNMPPASLTSTAIYFPSGSTSYSSTDNFAECPLAGCASSGPSTLLPDPALDSTPLGVPPQARPFAVDDTGIDWATSTIFGQPGNQIVRTP